MGPVRVGMEASKNQPFKHLVVEAVLSVLGYSCEQQTWLPIGTYGRAARKGPIVVIPAPV